MSSADTRRISSAVQSLTHKIQYYKDSSPEITTAYDFFYYSADYATFGDMRYKSICFGRIIDRL